MGAIAKPNGDVRPMHDATRGVNINTPIRILDRLEVPGQEEVTDMVARAREQGGPSFCISADIAQAHRRVKVRRSDWGELACRSSSSSKVLWPNSVGTFGVSSAFLAVGKAVWLRRPVGPAVPGTR